MWLHVVLNVVRLLVNAASLSLSLSHVCRYEYLILCVRY